MQFRLSLDEKEFICKPFLRWAGGKNWLVKTLKPYVPTYFKNYHEPFLGGGSVFFSLLVHKRSYLSDLNGDLIDTYTNVRDQVDTVLKKLKKFSNTDECYYEIRSKKFFDGPSRAAQFIFLNMTSFNGIYRVNRQGVYNVPFGHRYRIDFIQEGNLRLASGKLKNASLEKQDFEISFKKVKSGDFVFIDPPYTVAHENNGFIAYNQKLFSIDDQLRLAESLKVLNKLGVHYLVTNAYHQAIKDIYKGTGTFTYLERNSLVGGKQANRTLIKEYVIKNF